MTIKNRFLIDSKDIKQLIPAMGFCVVSDKITVEGLKVGFMYREETDDEADSGWRFLSGTESETYAENPNNSMLFEVNTVANYDPAIIEFLQLPVGSELEREKGTDKFYPIGD